jgi:hypothetical protein
VKKINDDPYDNNDHTDANDPFTCFTVHAAKLFRKGNQYQDYKQYSLFAMAYGRALSG